MSISSHTGIIILVIIGAATIIGVIIIAAVEARHMDKGLPPILKHTGKIPHDNKKD